MDPTKFVAKKGKAAAKKGVGATQWEILKLSGIPEEDIPLFRWAGCVCGGAMCGCRCVQV